MTISYSKGDIFESTAQVIVNPVNCKGHMGKGLALAFKQRYPEMFTTYQQECRTGELHVGHPALFKASTPWILNFPTKDHWRDDSRIEYIEEGLAYLAIYYQALGIKSIAFPKLGAGLGRLSWNEVGPLMIKHFCSLDIEVFIYISEGDREFRCPDKLEETA